MVAIASTAMPEPQGAQMPEGQGAICERGAADRMRHPAPDGGRLRGQRRTARPPMVTAFPDCPNHDLTPQNGQLIFTLLFPPDRLSPAQTAAR